MTTQSNGNPARRRTAFHEVGHAIVGCAVGARVTRVWLASDRTGQTVFDQNTFDALPASAHFAIAITGAYAGDMSGVDMPDWEDRNDQLAMFNIAAHFGLAGENLEECERSARDDVRRILDPHEGTLEFYAGKLMMKGELTQAELSDLANSMAMQHSTKPECTSSDATLPQVSSEETQPARKKRKTYTAFKHPRPDNWYDGSAFRPPRGYVFVEEALDRLGRQRFPGRWGGAGSTCMPVSPPGYVSFELHRFENEWTLNPVKLSENDYGLGLLSFYSKAFWVVGRAFIRAAEGGAIVLKYLHPIDGLAEQPLAKGVPSVQKNMILHAGRAFRPGETSNVEPSWVVVEEKGLRRWLDSDPFKEVDDEFTEGSNSRYSDVALNRAASAVIELANSAGMLITREWLWRIASEVCGPKISKHQFNYTIWKLPEIPKANGPPSKKDIEWRQASRPRAIELFRESLKPVPDNPSTNHSPK